MASEGVVYSDFEAPRQAYALVADAPAIHIDKENRAPIVRRGYSGKLWTAVSGSAQIATDGVVTIPGYGDGLLNPGGAAGYSNTHSWYEVANARTAIGLSADRRVLYLMTVDKAESSEGLTVTETAALLAREYGVRDALNLDGGGSTTMAIDGVVVNIPSSGERKVASNLAVYAPAS